MRSSSPVVLLSNDGMGKSDVSIQHRLHPDGEYEYERFDRHVVSVNVGEGLAMERVCGALRSLKVSSHTGAIGLVPADRPAVWKHRRTCEFINLGIDPRLVESLAREEGASKAPELIEVLSTTDRRVEWLALSLLSEARIDGLGGQMYIDSLVNLLVLHLLRNHSVLGLRDLQKIIPDPSGRPPKNLPLTVLQRVDDYVGDNLSGSVSVKDMASVASLSQHHFGRLFKQTTGQSPHQYVISLRVKRAKELLSSTSLSIGEISLLCGFSNQQHMARHFQRLVGTSPTRFRREVSR